MDLPQADSRPITEQKTCPIMGKPLGSMGTPVKVVLNNQPVFLCCEACEAQAKEHAAQTLAKVKELKAKTARDKHNHP
jgi:hypothetical protein